MALFSQDDSDEDETPGIGAAFSGGQEPDEQTETPSPDEVDNAPQPSPADDSSAYAQSSDEQEELDQAAHPAPGGTDDGEGFEYGGGSQDSSGSSSKLPSMPQYVDNLPNYQALENEIKNFKPSDYEPSIGRRIGAALSGGAVAFGSRNPEAGMRVAESVNNAPLNRARAAEQQLEQGTRETIADVNAQNQTRQAQYQNQRVAANDAALNQQRQEHAADYAAHAVERDAAIVPQSMRPVDPKNPLGNWQGTDVKGRTVSNLGPPASYLNSPQGKAAQAEQTISQARAAGHPFTPEQEAVVRSGGHITMVRPPTPRQPAAGELEYNGALAAFKASHGGRGPQTTAEQNEVSQAAHGTMKDVPDEAQAVLDATDGAKEAYAQQFKRDPATGGYTNVSTGALVPAQEFASKIDKFRTDANVKLQKMGYQIDPQGNFGPVGQRSAPASQPAGQQPPAQGTKPASQPQTPITPPKATTPKPAGATGRVRGSDGNWYWIAGNKVIGRS